MQQGVLGSSHGCEQGIPAVLCPVFGGSARYGGRGGLRIGLRQGKGFCRSRSGRAASNLQGKPSGLPEALREGLQSSHVVVPAMARLPVFENGIRKPADPGGSCDCTEPCAGGAIAHSDNPAGAQDRLAGERSSWRIGSSAAGAVAPGGNRGTGVHRSRYRTRKQNKRRSATGGTHS